MRCHCINALAVLAKIIYLNRENLRTIERFPADFVTLRRFANAILCEVINLMIINFYDRHRCCGAFSFNIKIIRHDENYYIK